MVVTPAEAAIKHEELRHELQDIIITIIDEKLSESNMAEYCAEKNNVRGNLLYGLVNLYKEAGWDARINEFSGAGSKYTKLIVERKEEEC